MTVQLTTKPVLSQPGSVGWCRSAVFSESEHLVSPESQPVWLVSVASEMDGFEETGLALLHEIETAYKTIELKSAEALFQVLNSFLIDKEVSVVAACFSLTTATVMTKGSGRAILLRGNQSHLIVENKTNEWQAIEGGWQSEDIWWLQAGKSEQGVEMKFREGFRETFESMGEELGLKIGQDEQVTAGLLVGLGKVVESETETTKMVETGEQIRFSGQLKKKRRVLLLGWLVLGLLIVSVVIGSRAREEKLLEEEYADLSSQVEQSIVVADALYATDQIKAREQIREIASQIDTKKVRFEKNETWLNRWQELSDKVQQNYQRISGEKNIDEPGVWYPLATVKANFVGKQMLGCGNELLIWDEVTATMVTLDAENKRNDIVAGGNELTGLKHMACDVGRAVALTDSGVVEVSLNRRGIDKIIDKDLEWLQPELVGIYNGNVYLVDVGLQNILRYPAITGGVGAKQTWLGSGVNLSSSAYLRMAIDGKLWLLQNDGKIVRYTRGSPQSFVLSGFDEPLGNRIASLAVDAEKDRVAILDSENNRVVVVNKEGVYQKQLVWQGFSTAVDIAFLTNQDTLFVLNQGNIYAINF